VAQYVKELQENWRPVAAAFIGMAAGLTANAYAIAIMGPHLIAEFGWSKGDFTLVGALGIVSVLFFPLVGRLSDVLGARRTAMIGAVACPITFLGFTQIDSILSYGILFTVQCALLVTTTSAVYCRVIVQYITKARGIALGIAACGPPAIAGIGGPLLNNFVDDNGWRAGYLALAIFTAIAGVIALTLMPPDRLARSAMPNAPRKSARQDYAIIARSRSFWVLTASLLLCALPQGVLLNQLNLVLGENGITGKEASIMISAYAAGTLMGRLISGAALDRFPAPAVAMIVLGASAGGLLTIASSFDAPAVLWVSVLLIGLGYGAEGDVLAYLVVRNFGLRIYSTVLGLVSAIGSISSAMGAVLLSVMLDRQGTFAPYLVLVGILVLVGSLLFLLMPNNVEDVDAVAERDAPTGERSDALG
jgi:MFS family permease